MFQAIKQLIETVNEVNPRVLAFLQFLLLLCIAGYGGHLYATGHETGGVALCSGTFALLKLELGSKSSTQDPS